MCRTVGLPTRNHITFMHVKILKRPYAHVSSDIQDTPITNVKNDIVETLSNKTDSPQKTSSSIFIAKSEGKNFKSQQFTKPNVPTNAMNKEKMFRNYFSETF